MHSNTQADTPRSHSPRGCLGHCLAVGDVKRRQIAPTLLISAGAIVLLTCSTAFETPGRNKQTLVNTQVMQGLVGDVRNIQENHLMLPQPQLGHGQL